MTHEAMAEFCIGPHRLRVEPPDQAHIAWIGEVTSRHVLTLFDYFEALRQPRIFLVNDLSRSGIPNERTRKDIVRDARLRLTYAMACVGAKYPIPVVMNLLLRAAPFLIGGSVAKVTFVHTEAEARAWLRTQREQLATVRSEEMNARL